MTIGPKYKQEAKLKDPARFKVVFQVMYELAREDLASSGLALVSKPKATGSLPLSSC